MRPNLEKLNELLKNNFNNNKSAMAKALKTDRGQLYRLLKGGFLAGTVFWCGLYLYCKDNSLNFEEYIIFD